jgi:hypothetical protein
VLFALLIRTQSTRAPWNSLCGACQHCYVQSAAAVATMLLWQQTRAPRRRHTAKHCAMDSWWLPISTTPRPPILAGARRPNHLRREPKTDSKRIVCKKSLTTTERYDTIALRRNQSVGEIPQAYCLGGFFFYFGFLPPHRVTCSSSQHRPVSLIAHHGRAVSSAQNTLAAVCGFTLLQFR